MSVLIEFGEELPERVFLDYVSYRVRAFERGPLRCYWCQDYGHVAAVCRRTGAGDVGRTGAQKKTDLTIEQAVCIHCKSNHEVG